MPQALFEVHLGGLSDFKGSVEHMKLRVDRASRAYITEGLLIVASDAKKVFKPRPGGQRTSQKTGHIWYSFTPPFQATPPTPTSRSGSLQSSIGGINAVTMTGGGWMGVVGTKKLYAPYVEFGTKFMKPEPFMEKALDDNRVKLQELAEEKWAEAMES